jgi:hypothetical protein
VRTRLVTGAAFCDAELEPGDVALFECADGTVEDLAIACPGCGRRSSLPLVAGYRSRWTVTGGDVRAPASLTLSPSIWHRIEDGGCGWHGYLRNGVFEPCG